MSPLLTLLMPEGIVLPPNPDAPKAISDVPGSGNVGGRAMQFIYDGSNWPQQIFINGATTYSKVHLNPDGSVFIGDIIFQGTGWWPGPHQDPTKRQMVVDAQSTTPQQLAAVGQTFLAYLSKARLKGTLTTGTDVALDGEVQSDAWDAGQMMSITDARLPTVLNGVKYPIQRVVGKLIAGRSDFRVYDFEFGDEPFANFFQKWRQAGATRLSPPRQAARVHVLSVLDANGAPILGPVSPQASQVMTLRSQMTDPATFRPIQQAGLQVHWNIDRVVDLGFNDLTLPIGSLSPTDGFTDVRGQMTTTFTADSRDGLFYFISAVTPGQGA